MEYLSPLSSSLYIMQNAEHVSINLAGIQQLVEKICENSDCPFNLNCWANQELTPSATDERSIEWIFVTSLLNFSFWSNSLVNFEVLYRNKTYTGYWALCAAINRALDEGPDILNPKVYQSMTVEQLRHIFRSHTAESIPLFDERLNTLKDAGKTLLEHFNGSFKNALFSCDNSAAKLLKLLFSFLKRAQILVGDMWLCFEGKGFGFFYDIEQITAFADYRVPQVLNYFGVIEYSKDLTTRILNGEEIANGSELEVEIRAATISAVHNIVKFMKSKNAKWNSILVDNFLWYYRRSHANEIDAKVPMHRTRCIYY
ncbi:Queuosine salvage protein [Schistosoma japonicum]|nr:Queuosine salvage protein [Schistosoma japonicum]